MAAIKAYIESEGITQREAAERFNVAQPRISEIYQGKIELFSADKLINMLARVGRHVEISINEAAWPGVAQDGRIDLLRRILRRRHDRSQH